MKKTIKVTGGKYTLIRCDRFQSGSLLKCDSSFKGISNSMKKIIDLARKHGWRVGQKDICPQCNLNKIN
tara:strand:+ start:473 stop:679 length:207 start_codon:yes stop_codon:yes gene_type:complete